MRIFAVRIVVAVAIAPASATATAFAFGLVIIIDACLFRLFGDFDIVELHRIGGDGAVFNGLHNIAGRGFETLHVILRADKRWVRFNAHRQAVAGFDQRHMLALGIEHVVGDVDWHFDQHFFGARAHAFLVQFAHNGEGEIFVRTDVAGAVAMRALRCGGFEHAGAQALT